MKTLILKLALPFVPLFAIFNAAAIAVGAAQPLKPVLAGFVEGCEGKAQMCWYGIVPGVTTASDARIILARLGYTLANDPPQTNPQIVWETNDPDGVDCRMNIMMTFIRAGAKTIQVVDSFALKDCANLRLGDLFLVIPNPIVAYNCFKAAEQITFEKNRLWLNSESVNPALPKPVFIDDSIDNIDFGYYTSPTKVGWLLDYSWYGFMPHWKLGRIITEKYCR